jgi:hypothetical protein
MIKIPSRKGYVLDGIRDDTGRECNLRGICFELAGGASEPQLHQVGVGAWRKRTARRHAADVWKLSDSHRGLVAGVAAGAVDAVFHYFVLQGLVFDGAEVKVVKEGRDAGEETDALDATGFGLIENSAHEHAAGSVSLGVGTDDDGAEFGEVLAVDVERGAADELVQIVFHDGEGRDVLADLRVTPGEQGAVVGEAVDELVNGACVLQLRSTRSQGSCCELVFR